MTTWARMALAPGVFRLPQILYVHWNESEAGERAVGLMEAGYDLPIHWGDRQPPRLGDTLPDAVVISLDRLPSHGRAIAEWFWGGKRRRHVPILFEGGQRQKTEAARQQFPDAHFCEVGQTAAVVASLLTPAAASA